MQFRSLTVFLTGLLMMSCKQEAVEVQFAGSPDDCFIDDDDPSYSPKVVIAGCRAALRDPPSVEAEAEARFQLGIALRNDGDLEASRAELEKARELSADDASGLRMLAWTYREIGEHELAELTLSEAIELEPDHWQGYLSRCVVRGHGLKNHQAAADDCQRVLDLGHESDDSVFFASYSYNELGRFDETISIVEQYADGGDLSARVYEEYIFALESAGQTSKALNTAEAAIYNHPESASLQRILEGLRQK